MRSKRLDRTSSPLSDHAGNVVNRSLLDTSLDRRFNVATPSAPAAVRPASVIISVFCPPMRTKLVPEHKHAEAFGLYAFSGKMSSLLGPFAYTTVLSLTGSNHRVAMSTILLFFVVGLLILCSVREREGTQLAERLNDDFRTAGQAAPSPCGDPS
jgi:hypothetical protein